MKEYPGQLERTRYLLDGRSVRVRPIRASDAPMEQDFVRNLCPDSRYERFMVSLRELPPDKLKYLTDIDYDRHLALVATVVEAGREVEVGVARYVVDPDGQRCEFAVAVGDDWQGTGVAGVLMFTLMDAARARGLKIMEGLVLANNHRMLKFARQLGFSVQHCPGDASTVHIERAL